MSIKPKHGSRIIFIPLIFILLSSIFLLQCGRKKDRKVAQPEATVKIEAPSFSSDSAYYYIERQVAFGPRVPNTKPHAACAEWLEARLRSFGAMVSVQKARVTAFDGTALNISNIIGSFLPENPVRVLLSAHWDTRPFADEDPDKDSRSNAIAGANDGGSGVGVLLEIARQLSLKTPGIGVDIIFFDAEDYGQPDWDQPQKEDTWCLGSQYWAKNPHKYPYRARFGILLDMVGASDATFLKEETSMYYAPDVVDRVWRMAATLGFSQYFKDQKGGGVTDDHYYINTIINIPTIDIIHQDITGSQSFFEYWHTHKDDMSNIAKPTLEAVGKTVLGVIYQINPV